MKDMLPFATNDTGKLEVVLPFDPSSVRISPIWVLYTRSFWLRFLKTPVVRQLDYDVPLTSGDVFNYTQVIHFDGEESLTLHRQLQPTRTTVLTHAGTVAIDGKYYFFDPNEGEDVKLYEYSFDPSVLK